MKVFVVGNAAVDETFAVEALPSAGASILGSHVSQDLGGKGANQALVLARAGLDVRFVAALGDDDRGAWLRRALAEEGLGSEHLVSRSVRSDVSVILTTGDGDNAIVTTTDAAGRLRPDDLDRAFAAARPGDWLVLQGNLELALTRHALEAARSRGMVAALNPSPVKPGLAALWSLCDLVVLNRGEAVELTGCAGAAEAAIEIRRAGAAAIVVTLGAEGALHHDRSGTFLVPARRQTPADTTGAGDSFMGAAIASAALRGLPALDRSAVEAGTAAAALTISRIGARRAFPTRAEMAAILG